MPTNEARAERAEQALQEYDEPEQMAAVIDLLTDLRHLCGQREAQGQSQDFQDAMRISEYHYEAELNGEDG